MSWNCLLLSIGVIIVMCAQHDAEEAGPNIGAWSERCVSDSGKTIYWAEIKWVSNSEFTIEHFPNKIYYEGEYYNFEDKIYAMHDPSCSQYVCSPWVFHPACLIYCPGLFCLPVIILGALVTSKTRN